MSTAMLDAPARETGSIDHQSSLLDIDPAEFRNCFGKRPFLIGHRLCEHPLFELDRLLELARTLPEKHIEYNAGTLPINQDQALTPRNGLSAADTIRRIRDCKSWLVLKWVEHDPEYRAMLEACLDEVRPHSEPLAPGMRLPQAFIFITSPGSVTPYHMDPEHNFLLQIRGSKIVRQFDGLDPTIVTHDELERFYGGKVRNMTLRDENRERCWTYDLPPGQGLHFPVTFPHWVQNGGDVSVSFSITFRTPDLDRRRNIYTFNHYLRQWGLAPRPPGLCPTCDTMKHQFIRAGNKLRETLRRDE
jgi:hypothetical protein